MKNKTPFILVLIGSVFGIFGSLIGIGQYFLFGYMKGQGIDLGESMPYSFMSFDTMLIFILISAIVALIISISLIVISLRMNKNLTRKDSILALVLGIIGFFSSMGIGGILVIIGASIGISKTRESDNNVSAVPPAPKTNEWFLFCF